jgi:pimeloyl-ACP methyl ester carboxylesterase
MAIEHDASTPGLVDERIDLSVDGVDLAIAAVRRGGHEAPVVFLHGFGSGKDDFVDFAHHPAFAGRPFLAYDAPGCGETQCGDLSKISISFLVRTAEVLLAALSVRRIHLIGHSMGGLTALLLAHRKPDLIISFVNIEGNLTPEDCFLSRQIVMHPTQDADAFLAGFVHRARHSPQYSSALYASGVRHKVRTGAVRAIFESMVELSDRGELLARFLCLPCPRMFLYGEQNASLSYLPTLTANGVEVAEIPYSGHWPMYSNPVAMWKHIAAFHARQRPR